MRGLCLKCRYIYIYITILYLKTLEVLETRLDEKSLNWNLEILCKITSSTRLGGKNNEIFSIYHSARRVKLSYIPPTLIKTSGIYQPKGKK